MGQDDSDEPELVGRGTKKYKIQQKAKSDLHVYTTEVSSRVIASLQFAKICCSNSAKDDREFYLTLPAKYINGPRQILFIVAQEQKHFSSSVLTNTEPSSSTQSLLLMINNPRMHSLNWFSPNTNHVRQGHI